MAGHVAVVTFPFTSHPLPLFNLILKLADAAPQLYFSFFGTAESNQSLVSSTHRTKLPANMKTYDLENRSPEGVEVARNPAKNVVFFIQSMPESFRRGLDAAEAETGRKVTCLVTDAFFSFAVGKLAEEMKLPWVSFWVAAPYALSAHYHMDLIQELHAKAAGDGDGTLDAIPGLSAIHFRDLPVEVLLKKQKDPDSEVFSSMIAKMGPMLPKASAVIMNSYEEINPEALTNDLKYKFQHYLYVGFLTLPVPPPLLPPSAADKTGCLSWLDGQRPLSVAYISFGTIAPLPQEELRALAEALEESGVPFLWSLKDNFKQQLPDGFLERTSPRGKVVPWTPQTQVLGHGTVGVHVTHCGYNSVCESILCGVPMIGRSMWADNHMNARMVEEVWGIGVKVEGGVITKSRMLKCLNIIFHDEIGNKIREAACALKDVVMKAAGPDGAALRDFKSLLKIVSLEP